MAGLRHPLQMLPEPAPLLAQPSEAVAGLYALSPALLGA